MRTIIGRLPSPLCLAVSLAYLALAIWMHVWVLEAGVPQPGEPAKPHHQVCTWIGTSGEAGLVSPGLPLPSKPTLSCYAPSPLVLPVPSDLASTLQARAPPV